MKQNKYIYLTILQGNYGYGWDDLTESESAAEVRRDLRDYRENDPSGRYRVIRRRVIREAGR